MRRNARMMSSAYSARRQHDPILVNLYNQGLQMGLPQHQAARILNIAQRPRLSSAYGNPASASPATGNAPYGSSMPSYGSSPYRSQAGNVDYQQFAVQQASDFPELAPPPGPDQHGQYQQQLVASEASDQYSQYEELTGPQASDHHGQHTPTQPVSSATPQIMNEGTTYYCDPNQPSQAMVQHEPGVPLVPIYGGGYSHHYNYDYETYTPLNPIPEGAEPEHRYSHESYGPDTYAGEPYIPESYARDFGRGFH